MEKLWKSEYAAKLTTAEAAVKKISDGDTVYIGTCSSTAYALCRALGDRGEELRDVTLTCSQIIRPLVIMSGKYPDAFRVCTYFMGMQERALQKTGRCDFTSVHLSQINIFCEQTAPANVAFLEVSPPDENGYMSFGATGVALHTYVQENADTVILQVNRNVPYVYGDRAMIHVSDADMIVEADEELVENPEMPVDDTIRTISDFLLEQIPDGACIQLGLGGVANAVGYGLQKKNDLGAHTELMSDSIMELMRLGMLNNSRKSFYPGKTVASFTFGSRRLYNFVDHNPDMHYMPFPVVNDPVNIAKNDNMISINTALSIDLLGQVNADNIGGCQYSATGGQVDFVRGAQMSRGGKSFIAVTSSYQDRRQGMSSRIVSQFPAGTAVTTPRSDVQYVVTEYGCVNLKPLTMRQRAQALIALAHPDFRLQLTEEARRFGIL